MEGEDEDEDDDSDKKPRFKTEREIELELGDDYSLDLQKKYLVPDDQKYDVIPETWNGHNIADFIDPDIMEKLDALEKEEREAAGYYDSEESEEDAGMEEIRELAGKIRYKKAVMTQEQKLDNTTKPTLPRNTVAKKRERSVSRLKREFEELGVDMDGKEDSHFARSRSAARPKKRAKMEVDGSSKTRSTSRLPRDQSGVKNPEQAKKLKKMAKKTQNKAFSVMGKAGESDRHIAVKKPKHLFSGKRGMGKTDRR